MARPEFYKGFKIFLSFALELRIDFLHWIHFDRSLIGVCFSVIARARCSSWRASDSVSSFVAERLRGTCDRVLLAVLLACGLRRYEVAELTVGHPLKREDRWAIVDLVGKGGHIRTIPVPDWAFQLLN